MPSVAGSVQHDGKLCFLKHFYEEKEAAHAFDAAARRLRTEGQAHGGRAGTNWWRLNFPDDVQKDFAVQQGIPSSTSLAALPSSKVKGVSWDAEWEKWRIKFIVGGQGYNFGRFDTQAAAEAEATAQRTAVATSTSASSASSGSSGRWPAAGADGDLVRLIGGGAGEGAVGRIRAVSAAIPKSATSKGKSRRISVIWTGEGSGDKTAGEKGNQLSVVGFELVTAGSSPDLTLLASGTANPSACAAAAAGALGEAAAQETEAAVGDDVSVELPGNVPSMAELGPARTDYATAPTQKRKATGSYRSFSSAVSSSAERPVKMAARAATKPAGTDSGDRVGPM